MNREQQLEKALSDILAIIDGEENKAEAMSAWIHGVRCDPEISRKNGEIIEEAYKLLGRCRAL